MKTARLATALAALIVTTACPSEALASDGPMKDVTVQIVTLPGIDPGTLSDATAIVGRIYDAFGVRLHMSASAEPSADGRTPWRRIVVKPSATKDFPSAFGTSRVMGISPRNGAAPGRIAYVFYDAVSQTAKRHDLPVFALLGYAMAHELGHLLLPAEAHGQAGVMRGNWDSNDMKMMRLGTLAMADRETALVRHYLDSLQESR
jgi:hypothetical protein